MQLVVGRAAKTRSRRGHLEQVAAALLIGLVFLLLSLPVLQADRSQLTSDESLYLAEGLNIANGKGFTYPTGEPITHRPPLYPAALAGAMSLLGHTFEDVYWLPRIVVVANILLIFLLARSLFGLWGGVVAGVLAAISPYLRGLGTTLFLDGAQTAFLLGALLLLSLGIKRQGPSYFLASGVLLGGAFLVKESAVLLLPLPAALALFYGLEAGWKRQLLALYGGFALVSAWWWPWVYLQTGRIFLVGDVDSHLGRFVIAGSAVGVVSALAWLRLAPGWALANRASRGAAVLLLLGWAGLFLIGLELTGWEYERDYLRHVPSFVSQVFASNVQPAVLVLVAWILAFAGAWRGSRQWGMLAASVLLYGGFALVVADRNLSLRDLLPLVYLSYVALGGAAAALVSWGASLDDRGRQPQFQVAGLLAGAVILVALLVGNGDSLTRRPATSYQDDWHNALTLEVSDWLVRNVEPGSVLMSSRLYYSHIYFLTEGAFEVHQMPTVSARLNLAADGSPAVRRLSTLFRWEDHLLPADAASDSWIYLTRYPGKGYLVALAERDLLDEVRDRGVVYLVLSSRDAGFSSPSLFHYFEDNAAFTEVFAVSATTDDQVRVYAVQQQELVPRQMPAIVTQSAYDYVTARIGAGAAERFLNRLNPSGFGITPY